MAGEVITQDQFCNIARAAIEIAQLKRHNDTERAVRAYNDCVKEFRLEGKVRDHFRELCGFPPQRELRTYVAQ